MIGSFDSTPLAAQAARIAAILEDGERLLWSARPRPGDETRLDPSIWSLPIFWMVFGSLSFALGAYSFARDHGCAALADWSVGPPTPFVMAPLLLIGLWLLAAPWRARVRAAGAVYALSDRRMMRFDGKAATPSRSIAIAHLGPVESDEGGDGYGALHFRLRDVATGKGRSIVYWRCRGLARVADVRRLIATHILPR